MLEIYYPKFHSKKKSNLQLIPDMIIDKQLRK